MLVTVKKYWVAVSVLFSTPFIAISFRAINMLALVARSRGGFVLLPRRSFVSGQGSERFPLLPRS